ncbi:MAG: energy transducer TonB [Acidobacteriota bacterium]
MRKLVCLIVIVGSFAIFAFGQTNKNYGTPVKIIHKPRANYQSQEKGTICAQGTVTLRVQFLDTGEIGKIAVVIGLPDGFNECAIEAAKKINFKPAMKDGKSVTVFKMVQYNFTFY